MICISILEKSPEICIAALAGLEFAEVRLDGMGKITDEEIRKIFSQPVRLIATCRGNVIAEGERKRRLLAAIDAGAAFVDVDVEAGEECKRGIVQRAKERGCKVICSYHNYEKTPKRAELEQTLNWCFESGADIAKIACKVNAKQDNARLLGLLDSPALEGMASARQEGKEEEAVGQEGSRHVAAGGQGNYSGRSIIVIGMGAMGKITRIVAPLLGSPFTFASLGEGKETAEGQMAAEKMRKLMGELENG
jgi:3-dehydroquinate dehydratase-1